MWFKVLKMNLSIEHREWNKKTKCEMELHLIFTMRLHKFCFSRNPRCGQENVISSNRNSRLFHNTKD